MYCSNCGNKLIGTEKFCGKCGTKVSDEEVSILKSNQKYKLEIDKFFSKYESDIDHKLIIFNNDDVLMSIKPKYLEKIHYNFMISDKEKILMIYDNGITWSGKKGIVVTDKNVYMNSGNFYRNMTFNQFVNLDIHYEKSRLSFGSFPFVAEKAEILTVSEVLLSFQEYLKSC